MASSYQPESTFDKIHTHQSLAFLAFCDQTSPGDSVQDARQKLLMRYRKAIRRYLGGWFKNDERADEAAQEVYCRILAGECGMWDPTAYRFRTFVLREVKNTGWELIKAWSRDRQWMANVDTSKPPSETEWFVRCHESMLDHTWALLESNHRDYFIVLRLRIDQPGVNEANLAQTLGLTNGTFRTRLSRARRLFAELIWTSVRDTLPNPTATEIRDELCDLKLMAYVQGYLSAV